MANPKKPKNDRPEDIENTDIERPETDVDDAGRPEEPATDRPDADPLAAEPDPAHADPVSPEPGIDEAKGDDTTAGDSIDETLPAQATPDETPDEAHDSAPRDDGAPGHDATAESDSGLLPAPVAAAATPARSGPGFMALLLGGFLAGAIGYLLAYFTEFRPFAGTETEITAAEVDARVTDQQARLDEIEAALAAPDDTADRLGVAEEGVTGLQSVVAELQDQQTLLGEQIAAVSGAIDGLDSSEAGVTQDVLDELRAAADAGLGARLEEQEAAIAALQEQVDDQSSGGASADDLAALEERLVALSTEIAAQEEEIAAAQQAATNETRRVAAQAALARIVAAVENGEPFEDAVGALQAASDTDVPATLTDVAASGVATLGALQSRFPAAARDALDASLSETAGDGTTNRLTAFLRAQTGARSLDEREGDDPDAVLSRAEARLSEGDLSDALGELDALPEGGRAAMSDWMADARARLDAREAAQTLDQDLTVN